MTRYLQRLVARLPGGHASGDAGARSLVPFTQTPRGTEGGEPGDPFESAVSPPVQAPAPFTSGPRPPAAHRPPERRDETLTPRPVWPAPAEMAAPAPPNLPKPPVAQSRGPGSQPPALQPTAPGETAQPAPRLASLPTDDTEPPRAQRAPGERPTPDSPAATIQPINPPPAREPDTPAPTRPSTGAAVYVAHRTSEGPQTAERQVLEPRAPAPRARMPDAGKGQTPDQPVLTLHPPEPMPTPPTARSPQQPRVVIGRLTVEVVPTPPAAPRPALVRRTQPQPQRTSSTPSRSEPSRSKLRFGLGQM